MDNECFICSAPSAPYRCPNCRIKYCKVDCWKKHKENPCEKVIEEPKERKRPSNKPTQELEEDDRYICTSKQLKRLGQSESIKQSVKDERLQNMIKSMIDDPDPIKAIKDKLKNDPSFAEFAQDCLYTVGIRDDEGHCVL